MINKSRATGLMDVLDMTVMRGGTYGTGTLETLDLDCVPRLKKRAEYQMWIFDFKQKRISILSRSTFAVGLLQEAKTVLNFFFLSNNFVAISSFLHEKFSCERFECSWWYSVKFFPDPAMPATVHLPI